MADNSFQIDDIEAVVEKEETVEKSNLPSREALLGLSSTFKMLGDITRLKILFALSEKELCVQELAKAVDTSQSAVSHQLRLLRNTGIVDFKKSGRLTYYFISADNISELLKSSL